MSYNPQNPNGQETMANSSPVVIASDQSTLNTNVSQVGSNAIATNSGNASSGTMRVVIATDQPQLSNKILVTPDANSSVNVNQVGGSAIATNSGNASSGTQRVVLATDQPNFTTPINVTLQSATTGGDTSFHLVSAASNNLTNIKDGQSKVTGWYIYNNASTFRKIIFYNSASSSTPIVGTTTILFSIVIPALSGANVSFPDGINFSSGIWIATTTGIADSDSTIVALNDLNINIFYK